MGRVGIEGTPGTFGEIVSTTRSYCISIYILAVIKSEVATLYVGLLPA